MGRGAIGVVAVVRQTELGVQVLLEQRVEPAPAVAALGPRLSLGLADGAELALLRAQVLAEVEAWPLGKGHWGGGGLAGARGGA